MVKYAKNCRLGRRFLNRIFGTVNKRPDDDCWELEYFIINTMCGFSSGGDVRHAGDVMRFGIETGTTNSMWQHWYNHKDNGWVVVEKQGDAFVWTWFRHSRQLGTWVSLGHSCSLVFELIPHGNGGFNKVRKDVVEPSYEI